MVTGSIEIMLQLENFHRILLSCVPLYHNVLIIIFDANTLVYHYIIRKNIISNVFIK